MADDIQTNTASEYEKLVGDYYPEALRWVRDAFHSPEEWGGKKRHLLELAKWIINLQHQIDQERKFSAVNNTQIFADAMKKVGEMSQAVSGKKSGDGESIDADPI